MYTCRASFIDLDHVRHLDSFGTQFSNGFLIIAVNGLSLDKVWCDQDRVPPRALSKSNVLLWEPQFFGPEPGAEVEPDLLPQDVDQTHHVLPSTQPNSLMNPIHHVTEFDVLTDLSPKKARVSYNPKQGKPFRLSNIAIRGNKQHLRGKGGFVGSRGSVVRLVVPSYKNIYEVCISPSKELEEAETSSWLERKRNYDCLYGKSVAAEPT